MVEISYNCLIFFFLAISASLASSGEALLVTGENSLLPFWVLAGQYMQHAITAGMSTCCQSDAGDPSWSNHTFSQDAV